MPVAAKRMHSTWAVMCIRRMCNPRALISCRAPRRQRAQKHLILGDPDEFKAALKEAEQQQQQSQEQQANAGAASQDAGLPGDVLEAMQLSDVLRKPLQQAFDSIVHERKAMQQQSTEMHAAASSPSGQQSHSPAAGSLAATRDHRCDPWLSVKTAKIGTWQHRHMLSSKLHCSVSR